MAVLYKTTYQCPVCNLEKYFVGQEYEEPLEPFVCCAPMMKKAFKHIKVEKDAEEIDFPVLFREVKRLLEVDHIGPKQKIKSMENLEFSLQLNTKTRRVINRVTSYYGSTHVGLNAFVNDAILYYEQFLHILQSPELYKIYERFEKAKIREMRQWMISHNMKKYEHIFGEDIPDFGDVLEKFLSEDEDEDELNEVEKDSKDMEDGINNPQI